MIDVKDRPEGEQIIEGNQIDDKSYSNFKYENSFIF